jgi:hypothetical protein
MFGDLESRPQCNSKVPCTVEAQFPLLNLKFRTRINRFLFIKQNRLNLDVWWFNNPVPVELRGPPCFGNPNSTFKPSNFKHPQTNFQSRRIYTIFRCLVIFQPCLGGIKGSPMLWKPEFHLQTSSFKHPQRNFHPKRIYTNFRCWVIWKLVHTSSARNPNFCLKKYTYKDKMNKTPC